MKPDNVSGSREEQERSEKGKFPVVITSLLASLLSTLPAAAYLTGKAYHCAYLANFSVSCKLLTKSPADYFVYAYLALRTAPHLLLMFGAVLAAVILAGLFALHELRKRNERQSDTGTKATEVVLILAVGIASLLFAISMLRFPENLGGLAGYKMAEQDRMIFRDGCDQRYDQSIFCTDIMDGEQRMARGFIVDVSDKYVVVVELGLAKVVPINERSFRPVVTARVISDCFLDRLPDGDDRDGSRARVVASLIGISKCADGRSTAGLN